jgi:hypothetical protein
MTRLVSLIPVLAAAAIGAPGSATADQVTGGFAPITRMNLKRAPFDPCLESCFDIAQRERERIGPEPATPLYRISAAQFAAGRAIFVRRLAAYMNMPEDDINALVPTWDGAIREWRDEDPEGDYRPDDLADVLAKYWLFAWTFGGGVNPDEVTAAERAAVRSETHRLFQSDAVLALLTESQRQALAETLIRGQYADMLSLSTAGQDLGPVKESIVGHFQSLFDLDLRRLGLNNNYGFVVRVSE